MTTKRDQCRVVFALTSNGNDSYAAMTRLAVCSVRLSNPDVAITVACDVRSSNALAAASHPLIGEVDHWLPIETPEGSEGYRSRFVKTILPSLIERPFLFLDSDVFVRDRLNELFELDCDVAAAPNHSRDLYPEQIWDQDRQTLERMGWSALSNVYLNSGVILYKDTDGAGEFASAWHQNWLASVGYESYYRDQPAFNAALYSTAARLQVLPHRFNAQIATSPEIGPDAVIWHYYSSGGRNSLAQFDSLINDILDTGQIKAISVRRLQEARHPWISDGLIAVWSDMANFREHNHELRRNLDSLWQDQQRILSSRSWRITKYLRTIDQALSEWFDKGSNPK